MEKQIHTVERLDEAFNRMRGQLDVLEKNAKWQNQLLFQMYEILLQLSEDSNNRNDEGQNRYNQCSNRDDAIHRIRFERKSP